MQLRDLSKTVLSLQPRCAESSKSLEIPQNQPFLTWEESKNETPQRSDRDATPHLMPPKIKITVETDKIPRHPARGWIFGSDPGHCDYLLDTGKESGVSGTHFEINHNWSSMVVMIMNLSSNQLVIKAGDNLETLNQGDKRALCHPDCYIEVGLLVFGLEIPDRGPLQSLYEENLNEYLETVKDAVPNLASMALKHRGRHTPAVKRSPEISISPSDKYHRRWKVGTGVASIVYNGINKFSGAEVALKDFRDHRTARRISSEIGILSRIAHVHITRYLEVIENPSLTIAMEFVAGGSLAELQNVTRYETLLMARQCSQAISYLHDQSITHRDIKPDNILIVSRGRGFHCKVADFGESSEKSMLTTLCGTSRYLAPEIFTPPYTKSVDIWSLGIVIVEFWYDWYPLCSHELSDTPRDSWLPDTMAADVPGNDTFQRNLFNKLDLTASRLLRWHEFIRRKLREEAERQCSMAEILLQMLADPMKRCSAIQCRYRLDSLHLPDGLEPPEPQERQLAKRNAVEAELDDSDTSCRSRCNYEQITGPHTMQDTSPVSLATISEESPSQLVPKAVSASDISNCLRRSGRLEERREAFLCKEAGREGNQLHITVETMKSNTPRQVGGLINLDPARSMINATNLATVAGHHRSIIQRLKPKFASTTIVRGHGKGTYVNYEDGLELCGIFKLPTMLIKEAMDKGQTLLQLPAAKLRSSTPNHPKQQSGI